MTSTNDDRSAPTRPLTRLLPEILTAAALLALAAGSARAQCGLLELQGITTDGADRFGAALALDGELLVVGAPRADLPGSLSGLEGTATVFARIAGQWVEEATLELPTGQPIDDLGSAVAIEGERVAIGVPGFDGTAVDQGAVLVFERQGGAWPLVATVTAPDALAGDRLGSAVAIVGETIYAGAPSHSFVGTDDGALYGFSIVGGVPVLTAKLGGSGLPPGPNRLGSSLATDGVRLVAGAPGTGQAVPFNGAVLVYLFDPSGAAVVERTIHGPAAIAGSYFGSAVDVSGLDLLVGAAGNSPVGAAAGSAWWIDLGDPDSALAELAVPDHAPGDALGSAVAIAGERCFVGRPRHSGSSLLEGGVDVFDRYAGGWLASAHLGAPSIAERPGFGSAIDAQGTELVVGAAEQSAGAGFGGLQAGRVYDLQLSTVLESLSGCPESLSLVEGGVQDLVARGLPPNAPTLFLVGVSGSAPGLQLDGLNLPLEVDALTLASLAGSAPIGQPLQIADALGEARATLSLAPDSDPALAGLFVNEASLAFDPVHFGITAVGAPVSLHLLP
ncbi:hypothetical protein [Engelhardtia mirabilis]|uniref:FG-GAP repeat protein n=1 Tax=Engelhardtia mirabilis TaxID=2528011 RepID=A0A518BLL3_9BACT|nr:hypothetical protein Pla133_29510 [Planctomycetes bacterium Pla133]QDV02188.1 hypothetical protein Pla86_29500 [Planctomycetes bacterium Pla86]